MGEEPVAYTWGATERMKIAIKRERARRVMKMKNNRTQATKLLLKLEYETNVAYANSHTRKRDKK